MITTDPKQSVRSTALSITSDKAELNNSSIVSSVDVNKPQGAKTDAESVSQQIIELRRQRNALLYQVEEHKRHISDEKLPSIPKALDEFSAFFTGYTEYFFAEEREDALRNQNISYERILAKALSNTRDVWASLSLAINQRYNPVYEEKLSRADALSQQWLKRAERILGKDRQPIIYFDKIFHIVRYPYQAYPLLGIPFDRFEDEDKKITLDGEAAMAHELGHYVFWNNGSLEEYNARMDQFYQHLAELILVNQQWPKVDVKNPKAAEQEVRQHFDIYHMWGSWLEETFADAFGTLMIGPKFAKSAQDILLRDSVGSIAELAHNDGEHPAPAIRPYISLAVLKLIARKSTDTKFQKKLEELIAALEKRWEPKWNNVAKIITEEDPHGHDHSEDQVMGQSNHNHAHLPASLNLEAMRSYLDKIVEGLLTQPRTFLINETKPASLLKSIEYWGKPSNSITGNLLTNEITEMDEILKHLDDLPLLSEQTETSRLPQDTIQEAEDPFGRFVRYVQDKHARRLKEPNAEPERTLWEELLDFDFVLNHDHGSAGNHGCNCHKHINGLAVSCT